MNTLTPHAPTSDTLTPDERAAQLTAIIDESINRLVAQLQEGHTAEYLRVLRFWSHFHRYSHGNVLLILYQRPEVTQDEVGV